MSKDLLTENEVIEGVWNYLNQKGTTKYKTIRQKADASKKERGVDLIIKLENEKKNGNWYFIEAKGTLNAKDRTELHSRSLTNFRWAISQIILRIDVDSTKNNHIYGIAMPNSEIDACIKLIHNNWALKHLKIRLYGTYYDENNVLTAKEYLPKDIYKR